MATSGVQRFASLTAHFSGHEMRTYHTAEMKWCIRSLLEVNVVFGSEKLRLFLNRMEEKKSTISNIRTEGSK